MSDRVENLLIKINQQASAIDGAVKNNQQFRYKSHQRLILETGKPFLKRVDPAPFQGKPKNCFQNCFEALLEFPELIYCEGYATDDSLPIAVLHAWLVNDEFEVIDPTWSDCNYDVCTYFGVAFNYEFVMDFAIKTKHYGILDSDYLNDYGLLQEGFPANAIHPKFC